MMKSSIFLIRSLARANATYTTIAQRSLATAVASQSGGHGREDVIRHLNQKGDNGQNDMMYSLSFGDDAEAFYSIMEPSALMKEQLQCSQNQLKKYNKADKKQQYPSSLDNDALPRSLEDIVRQKSRAIVVTECEKPFRVVDVNATWEGLCGYSFREAHGKTLGELLKGPNTDPVAATGLIAHLLSGEEAGAVLTNYTKDGREFRNRIRVGPVYDASGKQITHFVGVLQELEDAAGSADCGQKKKANI